MVLLLKLKSLVLNLTIPELAQFGIETVLLIVFFAVPILVVPATSELFELNKMYLVLASGVILFFLEAIKIISTPKPQITIPPLWKTGIIFLVAMAAATIFSIDRHVSFFGFYDRWNGGLWSWVSYAVIFFSLTQLPKKELRLIIYTSVASSILVAAWGIAEHFGVDASYWVQNVKARVFSTLGQPNWLAAYLGMVIPWVIIFYLHAKSKRWMIILGVVGGAIYTCFVFTFSRGGTIGLICALVLLGMLIGPQLLRQRLKRLLALAVVMTLITIVFATPLSGMIFGSSSSRDVKTFQDPGETGQIRLIVWKGALDIFTHNPLLGTGVETFGESFYRYRPAEMNQTPEWDFLFNKAHNEYLNFLATTGLVGSLSYLALLMAFFYSVFKIYRQHSPNPLFIAAAASTTGYLVQNIFSFSVVPLMILLILNLATLSFYESKQLSWIWPKEIDLALFRQTSLLLLVPMIALALVIFNLWNADIYYGNGSGESSFGATLEAGQDLKKALSLNPFEPIYMSELAYADALSASSLLTLDENNALVQEAVHYTEASTSTSPKLLSIWQTKAQVYEELGKIDSKYNKREEAARIQATVLAPTDPAVRHKLADFYYRHKNYDQAILNLKISLTLKPDLLSSLIEMSKIYLDRGDIDQAKIYIDKAEQIDPTHPEVISLSQKVGS